MPDNQREWWVSENGQAKGPYSHAQVLKGLQNGSISRDTHLCPVGGTEWKLARDWPDFILTLPPAPLGTVPVLENSKAANPFTNVQLPPVANWICIYALLVSPFIWCIYNLACCVTVSAPGIHPDSPYLVMWFLLKITNSIASLIVSVVLVIGGLRLKTLRSSGVFFLKVGIWGGIGSQSVLMLLFILVFAGASANGHLVDEETTAQTLISFVSLIIGLAELVFMIYALVWLYRDGSALTLTDN